MVTWYQKIISTSSMSIVTKQYALMSLTKLSTRFTHVTGEIQQIIDTFGSHLDADLQQRGVEFGQLFRSQAGMRAQLLEPMPVLEKEKSLLSGSEQEQSQSLIKENGSVSAPAPPTNSSSGLMDLLGPDDGSAGGGLLSTTTPAPVPNNSNNSLDDILGLSMNNNNTMITPSSGMSSLLDIAAPVSTTPVAAVNGGGGLDGLLNGLDTVNYTGQDDSSSSVPPITVYEKHGLRCVFTFPAPVSSTPTNIVLMAHNLTSGPIQDFVFQVQHCH